MHHTPNNELITGLVKAWLSASRWLACLLLGIGSLNASAENFCLAREFNVNGVSKHFYDTRYSKREGWNEINGGLGLTCQLQSLGNWDAEIEVGFLENSHRKTSLYGAYGLYYPFNLMISGGLKLIVANGYTSNARTHGIMGGPMPTVRLRINETVTVNVSVAPKANTFIFANLGIKF